MPVEFEDKIWRPAYGIFNIYHIINIKLIYIVYVIFWKKLEPCSVLRYVGSVQLVSRESVMSLLIISK